MTQTTGKFSSYDEVVLGAGNAGLMAATQLGRPKSRLRVALVSTTANFVERQRLQEVMVAPVTPRILSISAACGRADAFFADRPCRRPCDGPSGPDVEFICGSVTSLDADQMPIPITTDGFKTMFAQRIAQPLDINDPAGHGEKHAGQPVTDIRRGNKIR